MNDRLAALALVIAEKELALSRAIGELERTKARNAELEADLALYRAFDGETVEP